MPGVLKDVVVINEEKHGVYDIDGVYSSCMQLA